MDFIKKLDPLTQAKLYLVLLYSLMLFLVMGIFSTTLFLREEKALVGLVMNEVEGSQFTDISDQLSSLELRLFLNIFLKDAGLFVSFVLLSYLLSGWILKPVSESIRREKDFVANASHELKTPITAIQSACEVNLRIPNLTEDDYKKVLTQTLSESKRMQRIISELMLLSRADSGLEVFHFYPVSLPSVLDFVVQEMKAIAVKKGVGLNLVLPVSTIMVKGDSNKLKQLFLILIDNAIKYTNPGGIVWVILEAPKNPRQRVSVAVKDSGIGISEADISHVFERFYRGDKSHTEITGHGLGLSIAKWIVDMHKADIFVASELGKGTIFRVVF